MNRALLLDFLLGGWMASTASAADLTVDFAKPVGRIKPLHGVCNGPFAYGENAKLEGYHAEAGFPYARLHDVHWPCPDAVDVSTIFPLFTADADDPKNYSFAKTDDYLAAIVRNKSRIIYRLGESIEPWTHYHNHPPEDFQKWARVCVNIIRHYNEGWAKGFHHDIKYWEIWNEPEISPMWTGTRQQYFELYETAAKAVKAHDPSLKVGGPAATHINSELVRPFLAWCRDRRLPLDFLSWHAYYGVPESLARDAATARRLLDEYGFQTTESHLNEWRYLTTWAGLRPSEPKEYATVPEWFARSCRAEGAAFCATVLIRLQDSPVDVVCFYTADTSAWSMFGQFGIPTRVFYAFKAFNQLAVLPDRVACEGSPGQGIVGCAGLAADKKRAAVLAANFKGERKTLAVALRNVPWVGPVRAEIYLVDEAHSVDEADHLALNPESDVLRLDLPSNAVILVRLSEP
ncbi:MAG: hypothetical protein ABSF95_19310 [Verrucomicrobiota bacterium]